MSKFFILQRIFNKEAFYIKDFYHIEILSEEFKIQFGWPFDDAIDVILSEVNPSDLEFAYVDKRSSLGGVVRRFHISVKNIEDKQVKLTHEKTGEEVII